MEHSTRTWATYPLTRFDAMYSQCGVTMGWLVEGLIDVDKLDAALQRVTKKWPMLAGRLEDMPCSDARGLFQLRIPLGDLPEGYAPYILTSTASDRPLSHYVQLPLTIASDSLPEELFMDVKNAPTVNQEWIKRQAPLTYWHVTHFEAESKNENAYSCVGVTFSHGLFDGMGIASLIHALEAEMSGLDWEIPPLPRPGLNENTLQVNLERALKQEEEGGKTTHEYHAMSIVSIFYVLSYLLWHMWQTWWHGASKKIVLIPEKACRQLVQDAREAMEKAGSNVRLTTGDILAAWLFKTVFSQESRKQMPVGLSNMVSFRSYLGEDLKIYPHNAFVTLPYPLFTVSQLNNTEVHELAYILATARESFSIAEPLETLRRLKYAFHPSRSQTAVLACDNRSQQLLTLSNMSIGRLVDINWRGVGAGRTVNRYKSIVGVPVLLTSMVTIAGRLDDGSTVLDTVLNKKRLGLVEVAVKELIAKAGP